MYLKLGNLRVILVLLVFSLLIPFAFSSVEIVEPLVSLTTNETGNYTASFTVLNSNGVENVSISMTSFVSNSGSLDAEVLFSPGQFMLTVNEAKTVQVSLLLGNAEPGQYVASIMASGTVTDSAVFQVNVVEPDFFAPTILSGVPTGVIVSDTTVLALTTNEDATCKFSTVAGVNYDDMAYIFDVTNGTVHSKPISGLTDGNYKYYIRCRDFSGNKNIADYVLSFAVDRPPSAVVELVKEGPLRAGIIEVLLLTSEDVKYSPLLEYSYDGTSQVAIPLSGSGSRWVGYFIIDEDDNNRVGAFKFKGEDLSGNHGEVITKGGVFLVDTEKPKLVSSIITVPHEEGIKVKWYDEQPSVKHYNVYRKEEGELSTLITTGWLRERNFRIHPLKREKATITGLRRWISQGMRPSFQRRFLLQHFCRTLLLKMQHWRLN
ncbi:hypothetical protein HY501_03685 [Candidatus Woesearchaeota archaeon]|nr:hypothetical protein [Candidatus Woesearchaeota archaeon]